MIIIKTQEQIKKMRVAGRISGEALALGGEMVKPGVSTKQIDDKIRHHIEKCGAKPSFLGYGGFPASACISINNQVIHGIPSNDIILEEGDIVKIDVGAYIGGYHGDCAKTFAVGEISEDAKKIIEVTRASFYEGLKYAVAGKRIGDISHAIQSYAEERGCSVVRDLVGHGIGEAMHEDPSVPNFGNAGRGVRLVKGMTMAIEPMINLGGYKVSTDANGWTVRTSDGSLSAHYENTILITDGEPEILTTAD